MIIILSVRSDSQYIRTKGRPEFHKMSSKIKGEGITFHSICEIRSSYIRGGGRPNYGDNFIRVS